MANPMTQAADHVPDAGWKLVLLMDRDEPRMNKTRFMLTLPPN